MRMTDQAILKKALDLITDGCEPRCGCWELNSGPSEEQAVLLIAESSPQPFYLKRTPKCKYVMLAMLSYYIAVIIGFHHECYCITVPHL